MLIDSVQQFFNGLHTNFWLLTFQSTQSRSHDNWGVVTIETVLTQQFSHFHLDQFQHLGIVNGVHLVHKNYQVLHTNLSGQQQVLSGLRHLTVSGSNNNNGTVHLGGTSNHILNVIGVTWTVNVGIMSLISLVLNMGSGNGDTSGSLFWSSVDGAVIQEISTSFFRQNLGDSSGQSGLTMINVTNGSNVDMRLRTVEGCIRTNKGWACFESDTADSAE